MTSTTNKSELNKVAKVVQSAVAKGQAKAASNTKASIDEIKAEEKRTRAILKQMLRDSSSMNKQKWSSDISQLAAAIAMPKDYVVPRFGGSLGSDPTALANPWLRTDIQFPTAGSPAEMSTTQFPCFAFRDALRSMIFPFFCSTTAVYSANFFYTPTNALETYPVYASNGGAFNWVSGPDPHAGSLYLCRIGPADQHRGFLLSQNDIASITLNASLLPAGATLNIIVKRLNAGVWTPVAEFSQTSMSPNAFSYTATITGYYALSFSYILAGSLVGPFSGNIMINTGASTGSTVWAQRALPFYDESYAFVDAIRMTGVSLMYTNTTAPIARQGEIVSLQVPRGSAWLQFVSFGTVSTDKKSVTREIINGNYCFLKPGSTSDLDMKIYELPSEDLVNAFEDNVFDAYPQSDFLVTVASANSIAAPQTAYLTFGFALEYTTLSQWIEVRNGTLCDSEIKAALELISSMPQHHENDFHWDDIWSWIKDTASSVWSGVKEVLPIVSAVAPLVL